MQTKFVLSARFMLQVSRFRLFLSYKLRKNNRSARYEAGEYGIATCNLQQETVNIWAINVVHILKMRNSIWLIK